MFFLLSTPASASVLFSDHFDNDNLSNWTVVRNFQWGHESQPCLYNGFPAQWDIFLQRLGILIFGPGCFTEIIPSSFRFSADESYRFEFDMTFPESIAMDRNYTLRYIDGGNTLGIKTFGSSIIVEKAAQERGWSIPGGSGTYPFQSDHTYHITNEIRKDHSVKIFVDDQLVLDFIDPPPYLTGGTIGFRASVGGVPHSEVWFDNAVVTSIEDDHIIPVEYVSQQDPRWKDETYDFSERWSPLLTTIQRWGCTLTSAVMALRYFGITTDLADNNLTPSTLNQWLTSQVDGYIGNGYLNWIAITRFTKKLNDLSDSTILKYAWAGNDQELLKERLLQEYPTILELPKHFVVANGTLVNPESFSILDPYYQDVQNLSFYNNTFLTMRLLTPTHTNLSYILLTHNPEEKIIISGNAITDQPHLEEGIESKLEPITQQPPLIIHEISTPPNGEYEISISRSEPGKYSFTLYTYTVNAEVEKHEKHGYSDGSPVIYSLNYSQNQPSAMSKEVTPQSLISTLTGLYSEGLFSKYYVYWKLLQTAQYMKANQEEQTSLERYKQLFLNYIDVFSTDISKETSEFLTDEIQQMYNNSRL